MLLGGLHNRRFGAWYPSLIGNIISLVSVFYKILKLIKTKSIDARVFMDKIDESITDV